MIFFDNRQLTSKLLISLLLIALTGCNGDDYLDYNPDGDMESERDAESELLVYPCGGGSTDGNPAIVDIAFEMHELVPLPDGIASIDRFEIQMDEIFLSHKEQCDIFHGDALPSQKGRINVDWADASKIRLRMIAPEEKEYCAFDLMLIEPGIVTLEFTDDRNKHLRLEIDLGQRLPFSPSEGSISWKPGEHEEWLIALDSARALDPKLLAEMESENDSKIRIDRIDNAHLLDAFRTTLIEAMSIYRDANGNGIADPDELASSGLIASGEPARLVDDGGCDSNCPVRDACDEFARGACPGIDPQDFIFPVCIDGLKIDCVRPPASNCCSGLGLEPLPIDTCDIDTLDCGTDGDLDADENGDPDMEEYQETDHDEDMEMENDMENEILHCVPRYLGSYGGAPQAVVLRDGYAYLAIQGGGMHIVDLHSSERPALAGVVRNPGYAEDLALGEHTAYLAVDEFGLMVIDISDPHRPSLIQTIEQPGKVEKVDVFGERLYTFGSDGLSIYDISEPSSLIALGHLNFEGEVEGMAAAGDFVLLAAGYGGLKWVDVRNPAEPSILGSYNTNAPSHANQIKDVVIAGNTAIAGQSGLGLVFFDLSTPPNPEPTTFDNWNPSDLVEIDSFPWHLALGEENILYMTDGYETLWAFDIADISQAYVISKYDLEFDASGLAAAGDILTVTDTYRGLLLFDASAPDNIVEQPGFRSLAHIHDVEISRDYAYVATGAGDFQILDISEDTDIRPVAWIDTPGLWTTDVAVDDSIAAIGDREGGMLILDITDPLQAVVSDTFDSQGYVGNVAIYEDHAFTTSNEFGPRLLSLDIENPYDIGLAGFASLPGYGGELSIYGNLAAMAGQDGLMIFDLSEPSSPTLIGFEDSYDYLTSIVLKEMTAFVTADSYDLLIYDLSNPNRPDLVTQYFVSPGAPVDIDIAGDLMFLANGFGGLSIVDISSTRNPREISTYEFASGSVSVDVQGNRLYVGNSFGGLHVLDISECLDEPLTDGDIDGDSDREIDTGSDPFAECSAQLLSRFGGIAGDNVIDLALFGDYIYTVADGSPTAADDGKLSVYDKVSRRPIRLIGQTNIPGNPHKIAVSGSFAYVADSLSGIHIIDITFADNPILLETIVTPGSAYDMEIDGEILYVADGENGILRFDISNPTQPLPAGSLDTPGVANGIFIGQYFLLIADGESGLQIIETGEAENFRIVGSIASDEYATDVYAEGPQVYLTDRSGSLLLIDIANPESAEIIGRHEMSRDSFGLEVSGSIVYATNYNGLEIIDFTDPRNPRLLGSYDTPGLALGLKLDGTTAYVVDRQHGFHILDVEDPATIVNLGSYDEPRNVGRAVADPNGLIATTNLRGFVTIDIENPENPTLEGNYYHDWYYDDGDDIEDIAVTENHVFLAAGPLGLQIVDVSQREAPLSIGGYPTDEDLIAVSVSGERALMYDGTLTILDINDPSAPLLLGEYEPGCLAKEMILDGDTVYLLGYAVFDSLTEINILDISDPANIRSLSRYQSSNRVPRNFTLAENKIYLAVGKKLEILDVSDPTQPEFIGSYEFPNEVLSVAVIGNTAFAGSADDGMYLFDIRTPAYPQIVEHSHFFDEAVDISIHNGFAYISDLQNGLFVLDVSGCP